MVVEEVACYSSCGIVVIVVVVVVVVALWPKKIVCGLTCFLGDQARKKMGKDAPSPLFDLLRVVSSNPRGGGFSSVFLSFSIMNPANILNS